MCYDNKTINIILLTTCFVLLIDSYIKELQLSNLKKQVEEQQKQLNDINFLIFTPLKSNKNVRSTNRRKKGK